MSNAQNANRLQQLVADMLAIERQIEESFARWLTEVQEHAEAAEAVRRFKTMAEGQREAWEACLKRIGGSETGSGNSVAPFDMIQVLHEVGPGAASKALHAMTTAFNHATFGYAMLHTVAHRFNDRTGQGNATDMAEQHQRSYFQASQDAYRLIPDVVIGEMGESGECRCTCPSCSLGICLCWHAHVDSLMPVSPAAEGGIMVRLPKADSAALQAGLRQGDVILAVDGQKVQAYQELQAEIRKHEPGDEVHLQMLRGSGGPQEITVTCPR